MVSFIPKNCSSNLAEFQISLSHGADTESRIPYYIHQDMQLDANRLLSEPGNDGNYSVVFDFLLHKYYQFFVDLNATAANRGATIIASHPLLRAVADGGMSFGVKAVIVLVVILSILWIGCVLYLLVITFRRHKATMTASLEAQRIRKGLISNGSLKLSPNWLWTPSAQSSPNATVKIAPADMDLIKNGVDARANSSCRDPCKPKKFVTFEAPPPWRSPTDATELKLFDETPRSAGIHKAKRIRRSVREAAELERHLGKCCTFATDEVRQPSVDIPAIELSGNRRLGRITETTEDDFVIRDNSTVTKL